MRKWRKEAAWLPFFPARGKAFTLLRGRHKECREETAQDKQCGSEKMTVHVASRLRESTC